LGVEVLSMITGHIKKQAQDEQIQVWEG
jgi:hypothetical protein